MCGLQKGASLGAVSPLGLHRGRSAQRPPLSRSLGYRKPFVRAPVPKEESERNVAPPLLWESRDRSLSRPESLLSAAAPPQGLEELA